MHYALPTQYVLRAKRLNVRRPAFSRPYHVKSDLYTKTRLNHTSDKNDVIAADLERLHGVRISPEQPTTVGDDGTRTYRVRQHGNKPLPIPEIMDPIYLDSRHKHKHKKQEPLRCEEEYTPFQRKLALNPHAIALATSVRQCRVTSVRLPAHFLASFQPTGLGRDADTQNAPVDGEPRAHVHTFEPAMWKRARRSYVLCKKEVVAYLGRRSSWKILIPEGLQTREFEWPPGMPELCLQALREAAVSDLNACLEQGHWRGRGDIFAGAGDSIACVLRFEAPTQDSREATEDVTPGSTSSVDACVYELGSLFPPETLEALRARHEITHDEIVLTESRETTWVRLALEKLRDYLSA